MKDWMKIVPENERAMYRSAGFGNSSELTAVPVLVIVDVTYGFTGSPGLTLEEAITEYPTACGPAAWDALPQIKLLVELFRSNGWPLVFTRGDTPGQWYAGGATKRRIKSLPAAGHDAFPSLIAPLEGEWVLAKTKASAFFQTPLNSYLVSQRIGSVVICGVSTSGCVRATAVDSCSHGYETFVIEDCCFDRSDFAHCSNLFDLHSKYASVVTLAEFEELVGSSAVNIHS